MDYSNRWLMIARRLGQKLGILRPLQNIYRNIFNVDYEENFDKALMHTITSGDIVWDIGANVGIYTLQFAQKVGEKGSIKAFEPAPESAKKLKFACSSINQVEVLSYALSDFDGLAQFNIIEGTSPINSLASSKIATGSHQVQVRSGCGLIKSKELSCPNIIKIDVEGFEPDVLRGMAETLKMTELRGVFVEVHFLELNKRGLKEAPREMVKLLKDSGFKVTWCDPSHIQALR